ncbi:SDR family NAD(P)-dependent oxidoreductase [Parafrigoribacterium humi]|jgi:NAD(P)-dependent dehydrogenase (short-subunit alcohol dehydrogenase family)|uniref:SDR family NAD(P)-dependent oxidoreductase n=1 Tax=Parafrigoribacterium humi TaxID=3144664 RepID=UPI0032EB4443
MDDSLRDLSGTTMVITGASSGIGAAAATVLASRGAELAIVGRNPERTKSVAASVGGTPFIADFDRLDEVRALAHALQERYDRIDVLANNAGGLTRKRAVTPDGFERTFQSNHLAPFLLTTLLLPVLTRSNARVISTASVANLFGRLDLDDLGFERRAWLGGWRAYGTSKIETILFIEELARRTGLEAYSFHPGYVATNFGADNILIRFAAAISGRRIGLRPVQGAAPLIHLASARDTGVPSGTYFDHLRPFGHIQGRAHTPEMARALWEASATLAGVPA